MKITHDYAARIDYDLWIDCLKVKQPQVDEGLDHNIKISKIDRRVTKSIGSINLFPSIFPFCFSLNIA